MAENGDLSERELEILKLVATGASNKEIARKLYISTNTVKVHLRNIFAKIGVSSRTEAAMYAVQVGLVPIGSTLAADQSAFESTVIEERFPTLGRRSYVLIGLLVSVLIFVVAIGLLNRFRVFSNSDTSTIENTENPEWVLLKAMPTARFGMAAAVYENYIYLIGGDQGGTVTGIVERYEPSKDTWETLAAKPIPVAEVQAAVVGGRIYLPGGRLTSGDITDVLEVYDPRLDLWSVGSSLPRKISQYALEVYEGKLYLFGGWDGESYSSSVYEYDPDEDAWQIKSSLASARAFSSAVEVDGKIYIMGGYDGQKVLNLNEIYSPALDDGNNDPWISGKPLSGGGRYGSGSATLMNIIFLLGGKGASVDEKSAMGFEIESGEWQQIAPLPEGELFYPGVVALGNHIYLFGGVNEEEVVISVSRSYQAFYITVLPFIR